MQFKSYTGVLIAILLITAWAVSLCLLLSWNFSFKNPLTYLAILLQMHLYTGLFITAHDAMHGTISSDRPLNRVIGQICTGLYAAFPFNKLNTKHHQHHRHVHSEDDPDYHNGNFVSWYVRFMKEYLSIWQILILALIFNILKTWVDEINLLLFWVIPSLLSTLQLFYFGTWLPHHGQHVNKHHSRTQKKNHVVAFLSCYFFGYHYEHHDSPGTPWWLLWKLK
ncbi:fatty acid desaturase [Desertivirga xinjiangensis]|uniref:fatty acid desaturase n=1 Tax=Desertivirga xinjiangensis TaxID=539206 RepID=UPI0021098607|nr:fatty acid desaturase [Pedobacter xinjiangensis]